MAKQRTLACPHCGCDDLRQMRYVESASTYRDVLLIDGNFVVMEQGCKVDDGDGECWFVCCRCTKRFDIPDWAELEFDDNYEPADEEVI